MSGSVAQDIDIDAIDAERLQARVEDIVAWVRRAVQAGRPDAAAALAAWAADVRREGWVE